MFKGNQIPKVTVKQAYEWVKTGHWNLAQFTEWFDQKSDSIRSAGYSEGYNDAEYDPYLREVQYETNTLQICPRCY